MERAVQAEPSVESSAGAIAVPTGARLTMSTPIELFRHCPVCGVSLGTMDQQVMVLQCGACGFFYHFNPTVATGAFLVRPSGEVLFICRAKDPARDKLALPGGFIEINETAEQSLRREILEEVGVEAGTLNYLCSQPNNYTYRGVTYPVLDLFFVSHVSHAIFPAALDGVRSLHWLDPATVNPDDIAFPSIRNAVEIYRASIAAADPA
jgi:NAD+ diphosphatase